MTSRISPTSPSGTVMTPVRKRSERLTALRVSQNDSSTLEGQSTIASRSPLGPQRVCMMSIWPERVALPSPGPARCTFTISAGISSVCVHPMPSCISEMPGPAVAVIDFVPVSEAPMTAWIDPTSSSIWR